MTIHQLIALFCTLIALSTPSAASPRIAVLGFELNDITSLPDTAAEQQRTASMAGLLTEALSQSGHYDVAAVAADNQKAANAGFGYLFRFHDAAAELGRRQGADWIIVSQHSKPSFLFSYLWVYLIDVKQQTAVARYDIELKGNHEKVTRRGIATLADKIANTLAKHAGQQP